MRTPASRSVPPPFVRFFFGRIFPLFFIAAGGMLLLFGVKRLQWARESVAWPAADGVIRQSFVETNYDEGTETYHAKVLYDFTVDGKTFDGDVVAFGDYGSSSQSHAGGIVGSYPVGKNVAVYYKPDDPRICVLEPGLKLQAWGMPALGLIFFIAGCVMSVVLPRAIGRNRRRIKEETAGDSDET